MEPKVTIRLMPVPWEYGLGEKLYIGIKVLDGLPLGEIATLLMRQLKAEDETWEDMRLMDGSGDCGHLVSKGLDHDLSDLWTVIEAKYKADRLQIYAAFKARVSSKYLYQSGLDFAFR